MTWPFENNTNAITRKLAKRSLQADKRRNIFLIVTIVLTTALLSGIFFSVFAEQRKMLADLRGQYQTVWVYECSIWHNAGDFMVHLFVWCD